MNQKSTTQVKVAKYGCLALSAIICLIGIIFLAAPEESALTLIRIVGIINIVFGVMRLIGHYSGDLFRLGFQYDFEIGVVSVITGVLLLFETNNALNFLAAILGIQILVDGMFRIRTARDAKEFGITTWWLTMISASVACIVAIILIWQFQKGAEILMTALGVAMIFDGILNIVTVLGTVKITDTLYQDEIGTSRR